MLINLYTEMKKNGITQRDVAKELGIHEKTFGAKMAGRNPITVDELSKIQQKFFPQCSLDYLATKVK